MFLKWRHELNKLIVKEKEKKEKKIWIGKYFQMSKLPSWFICIKMFKYSS